MARRTLISAIPSPTVAADRADLTSCDAGAGNRVAGIATAADDGWTNTQTADCLTVLPLYCFEQA